MRNQHENASPPEEVKPISAKTIKIEKTCKHIVMYQLQIFSNFW
jgi:hypothetical protein